MATSLQSRNDDDKVVAVSSVAGVSLDASVNVTPSLAKDPEANGVKKSVYRKPSTFLTVEDERAQRPVDSYEGIHRWDPCFEWEREEEKKLVRKVGSSVLGTTNILD
jgi:hypothetical protein